MSFWNSLKKGISSSTGISQGSETGFRIINPNGPRTVTVTDELQNWNKGVMEKALVERFKASQTQDIANIEGLAAGTVPPVAPAVAGSNPYGVPRQPWIFATFDNLVGTNLQNGINAQEELQTDNKGSNQNSKQIIWYANPKSVDWVMSQRGTESKTKSGTVLHIWRDRLRRTDYDDPKITMTFQTGSIIPGFSNALSPSTLKGVPDQELPPGLNDFYKFLELVDASKIKNGQANLIHILYRSRIFPSMVLAGFFEPQSVVKFSDSSDNPFQVNSWSATFTIYKTVPRLNSWQELANQFKQEFNKDTFKKPI